MADHREVIHDRLYVRVPGTDKLRKRAAGRLKRYLADGWRETDRWPSPEYITVRLERTGRAPLMVNLPKPPPQLPRRSRGGPGMGGPRGPRR